MLRNFFIPLAALPFLFAAGCANDSKIINQAQESHAQLEPAVIEDPQVAGYVQQVGDRVVSVARELDQQGFGPKAHKNGEDNGWMFEDIKFHLVNSPTLNAFTTGGKHVYLYSELFNTAKTEDEFAAVVAHEFGHIYGRHVQKGTDRQMTLLGAAAAAGVAGYALGGENREGVALGAAGAAAAGGQFLGMGFTRKDEDEADKLGFQFYAHAGWDPAHFGDFFQSLIDKGLDTTPEMMSDHPKLANRVEAAKRRAAELPDNASQWRRPNILGQAKFNALQQRVVVVGKKMPNDQSLAAAQLLLSAFPSCVTPTEQPDQKKAQAVIATEYAKEQKK